MWLHCSGRVLVCSFLCSFFLPFWNLLGFFPLTSIAYRRVIRVYQYEVGDDLSGRFFPLIFLPHFGFQTHSLIPRLAFLPTNFHGLEMLGGLFPCWFFPRLVPSFLLKALGVRFISRRALSLSLNPVVRNTQMFGASSLYRVIQHLKSPFSRRSKTCGKTESSGDENLVLVTGIPEIQVLGTLIPQSQRTPHLPSIQTYCPCVGHPVRALTVRVGRTEIPKHGCLEIAWDLGVGEKQHPETVHS